MVEVAGQDRKINACLYRHDTPASNCVRVFVCLCVWPYMYRIYPWVRAPTNLHFLPHWVDFLAFYVSFGSVNNSFFFPPSYSFLSSYPLVPYSPAGSLNANCVTAPSAKNGPWTTTWSCTMERNHTSASGRPATTPSSTCQPWRTTTGHILVRHTEPCRKERPASVKVLHIRWWKLSVVPKLFETQVYKNNVLVIKQNEVKVKRKLYEKLNRTPCRTSFSSSHLK